MNRTLHTVNEQNYCLSIKIKTFDIIEENIIFSINYRYYSKRKLFSFKNTLKYSKKVEFF